MSERQTVLIAEVTNPAKAAVTKAKKNLLYETVKIPKVIVRKKPEKHQARMKKSLVLSVILPDT
jgi:hypothetical protein